MTREHSAGSGPRVSPRVVRAVGVATATVLLTAGCAAGQSAQTAYQKSSIDGTNRSIGQIDLRGLAIEAPPSLATSYPAGTDARITVVLINNARSADQLVGVKTAAAGGWAAFTSADDAYAVQQASAAEATGSTEPSAEPSGSSEASAEPSAEPTGAVSTTPAPTGTEAGPSVTGSESPDASTSTSAAGSSAASTSAASTSAAAPLPTGTQSVALPAATRKSFGTPEATGAILLTGLTKQLFPGNTINITFTFAKAGSVTIAVPVQLATVARTAEIPGGETEEETG